MKIDGSCHCGLLTYEAEIDPEKVVVCHCTDCQSLSASAFRVVVPASADKFSLSGEPTIYVITAESGARRAHAFCPRCGSAIYSTTADAPRTRYSIRVGQFVSGTNCRQNFRSGRDLPSDGSSTSHRRHESRNSRALGFS